MDWDKIGLWLLGIALVGLMLGAWKHRGMFPQNTVMDPAAPLDQSTTPTPDSVSYGRDYLIANQGPWAFAPPINSFLPSMVAGGGQPVMVQQTGALSGCSTCNDTKH